MSGRERLGLRRSLFKVTLPREGWKEHRDGGTKERRKRGQREGKEVLVRKFLYLITDKKILIKFLAPEPMYCQVRESKN